MALNLKQLKKISNNPWSFTLSDENNPYEITDTFDTGCLALNAICGSGDIRKGIPNGRRIVLSGESSTAKSFFSAYIIKSYLEQYKDGTVVLFETEGASVRQQSDEIGIDSERVIVEPVCIVEELHTIFLAYLDKLEQDYLKTKERTRVLFVIDSLGMLNSNKEVEDKLAGKTVKDMTIAQAKKALFRATSLKLSLLQCPLLVINHVYAVVGLFAGVTESGGSGVQYAGDVRLILSKSQKKTGTAQTGVSIKLKIKKSRWIKENQYIVIELDFEKGMKRNSYLVDWADKLGMLKATDSIVTFEGVEYSRPVFEEDFTKYFENKMTEFSEKVLGMLSFGSSDEDIENMSVENIIANGVKLGMISDTPRTIMFTFNDEDIKIKKNDLRSNPDLIPDEFVEQIKKKLKEEIVDKDNEPKETEV